MLIEIIKFFDNPFFTIVGGIYTVISICAIFYVLYVVIRGVLPLWYRLGIGLSKNKIAIFSSTQFTTLKNMLIDSKIFKQKNIIQSPGV